MDPETADLYGAYPRLTDDQIAALDAFGERRPTAAGDVLFSVGERSVNSSWSWPAGSRWRVRATTAG